MSERKVITKYYPPDFDPAAISRVKGRKVGPKLQPVRLMAPFSMRCTTCGEYIYKGRKFNARKETTDEKYYAISIFRFYIRCTRCSAEITFKTDPKNMDYTCERGARRNFEVWRAAKLAEETEEERLDRLEREEAENDAMAELEQKTLDAKTEMAIADALDDIRTRNARKELAVKSEEAIVLRDLEEEKRLREEQEDEEAAKRAFGSTQLASFDGLVDDIVVQDDHSSARGQDALASTEILKANTLSSSSFQPSRVGVPEAMESAPVATSDFKRVVKKKKNLSAALGIKKKELLV